MSKKKNILRAFRIAANVLTDGGVLFMIGNVIYNWDIAGPLGVLVNVTALVVSAGLRLRLELNKDSFDEKDRPPEPEGRFQKLLNNRNVSFYAATAAQSVVAATALLHIVDLYHTKPLIDFAIPVCNVTGNIFVICKKDFEKDVAFGAAMTMASLEKFPLHAALPVMALAALPSAIYAGAAGLSTYRALRKTEKGIDPLYLFIIGLELAAVINYRNPVLAMSSTAWAGGYLGLKANNAHKGVVESLRAMGQSVRRRMTVGARAAFG